MGNKFILFINKRDGNPDGLPDDLKLITLVGCDLWDDFTDVNPVLIKEGVEDLALVWEPQTGRGYGNARAVIETSLKSWLFEASGVGVMRHNSTDEDIREEQKGLIEGLECGMPATAFVCRNYSKGMGSPYKLVCEVLASTGADRDEAIRRLNEFFRPKGYEAAHELLLRLLPDYLRGELDSCNAGEALSISRLPDLREEIEDLREEIEKQRRWDGMSDAEEVFGEIYRLVRAIENGQEDVVRSYEDLYNKLGEVLNPA